MATEKQCKEFLVGYFQRNRQILPSIHYTVHPGHLTNEQTVLETEDEWFIENYCHLSCGFPSEYVNGPYLLLPDGVEVGQNCEPIVETKKPQEDFVSEHFMINETCDFGFLVVEDPDGKLHLADFMGG